MMRTNREKCEKQNLERMDRVEKKDAMFGRTKQIQRYSRGEHLKVSGRHY